MYRAMDIAKWFINKAIESGKPLTSMQILKLTYIAQGVHLAFYNEYLFGESCEAWAYGPVVSAIYQKTKKYKNQLITKDIFPNRAGVCPDDAETVTILNDVWKTFGDWTGTQLSTWTHRENSAWDIAYNKEGGKNYIGYDIAADLLKKEFSELIKVPPKLRARRPGWLT